MLKAGKKGIVLFVVLMTVILVIILGNIILGLMFGQNRFTHHKVSRIQAYYAGLAGIRYAEEMLRTNAWPLPIDSNPLGTGIRCTCGILCGISSGCPPATTRCPAACSIPAVSIPADSKLPGSIKSIAISVGESHSQNQTGYGTRKIITTVDYTDQ